MRKITVHKLKEKALLEFKYMKQRHPDLTFKRFFRCFKKLYIRGEIKLA